MALDHADNISARFISLSRTTPSFWLRLTFQMKIWAWRRGFSNWKLLCSWWEQDRFLSQVPFRFLKCLIGAGKEVKVKKDFQPCFAERKAHGGSRSRSSSPWNLPLALMKITRSSNFHERKRKIPGGGGSTPAASMGFSLSETRLEIFFDFDLFSCSNKAF